MFAETHSYLQLSYQITDRLLAAGKNLDLHVASEEVVCQNLIDEMFGVIKYM